MIGVKQGSGRLAVRKSQLAERGVARQVVAGSPVVVLYDPELDEGRAFLERLPGGETVMSPADQPGRYRDRASGSLWDASGRAVDGPLQGTVLPGLVSLDVMWFAWFAFSPDTTLIA